jgi:hypothetical protein
MIHAIKHGILVGPLIYMVFMVHVVKDHTHFFIIKLEENLMCSLHWQDISKLKVYEY